MRNLILTESYNGDHCIIVELPAPFIVEVNFEYGDRYVEVFFHDYHGDSEQFLYKVLLYVEKDQRETASYVSEHNIFTNFRRLVMEYIVEDIVKYMKSGFYFDDDEDACFDSDSHECFDIDHYKERWEQYIKEYLENPDVHFT